MLAPAYLIWPLTGLLLAGGLVSSIIPNLPGPMIILLAAALHGWLTGFSQIGWGTIGFLAGVTVLLQATDYLAGVYGVKKLGGGRAGVIGSVIGSIVGLLVFNLPGLVIGTFLGALIGELRWGGQGLGQSVKIGLGSVLGLLAGALFKAAAAVVMVVVFLVQAL